jgi:hypothetical protein
MIQDFDGLVGRFSRRRQCMAEAGVCAVTLSPTDEREFVLLVAQWAQILFTSGTLNMLCSG